MGLDAFEGFLAMHFCICGSMVSTSHEAAVSFFVVRHIELLWVFLSGQTESFGPGGRAEDLYSAVSK